MISVIFPTYNEEKNVRTLHECLVRALGSMGEDYEIIVVDDGSKDGTKNILKQLHPLTTIELAYNAGQSSALDAGIHHANGDIIIILDGDLQNDPSDIPRLVEKMREGYDVVVGWRKERKDPLARRIFSRCANMLVRFISGVTLHDYGCALRAFKKKDLEHIHLYGVMHIFIPIILASRGARIAEIPVTHYERASGKSKYPIAGMFANLADLFTIKFFYTYHTRPLVFFGKWGIVSLCISVVAVIAAFIIKFEGILGFSQTPLPVIAALFVILAAMLFMLGFLAEILIRIYYESQGKKPYHIASIKDTNSTDMGI